MPSFVIEIQGLKEMQTAFNKSPVVVSKILEKATIMSGEVIKGSVMREAPRGETGRLRDYVTAEYRPIQVVVKPGVNYAIFVHEGTKPHFPPVTAVSKWALRRGINPWALAVTMARKGTKENPFMDRAVKNINRTKRVQEIFNEALGQIINELTK